MNKPLVILDRDGILNKLLINPVTNLTDSPMTIEQIEIFPWVSESLKTISSSYDFVIATNQPSAAKGNNTYKMLFKINEYIMNNIDVNILDSFICLHREEDNCNCRKPKTGLLEAAFDKYPEVDKTNSWMVGDRAKDIIAGHTLGLNTALLNFDKKELDTLIKLKIYPTYIGIDLKSFSIFLTKE
jgi:D-glycero-D-manno-heptose 1,7-bisphosphate phosphatase